MQCPGLRELELQASVRYDDYHTIQSNPSVISGLPFKSDASPRTEVSNGVTAARYTVGLRYSPARGVILRASHGTGFLPPSVSQLTPRPLPNPLLATLVDPRRGNVPMTTGPLFDTQGGNPNLGPESSSSWSAGVVFEPDFLRGFRVSVDYSRIRKSNEITNLGLQGILDFEDQFPGRVVRDPLTDADRAAGYTGGAIRAIDRSLVNIANTRVQAIDAQLDYTWTMQSLGDFHAYLIGTYQPDLIRRPTLEAAPQNASGFSSGVLAWRGNMGLDWRIGRWLIGWNAQYYDSYSICTVTDTVAACNTKALNQGSRRVPSQMYHDLLVSYRLGSTTASDLGLRGAQITLGIQNVFDRSPPILATTGTTGGYSTYGDPRLRRFTLSLRASF